MTTYGSNLSECHYYLLEVIGGEGEVDRIAQPPPPGTGTFSGCLATETDMYSMTMTTGWLLSRFLLFF